jgi:hypothetical protein
MQNLNVKYNYWAAFAALRIMRARIGLIFITAGQTKRACTYKPVDF